MNEKIVVRAESWDTTTADALASFRYYLACCAFLRKSGINPHDPNDPAVAG